MNLLRLMVGILCCVISQRALAVEHPSLLLTAADYSTLQARAATWPWSAMKTKAIDNSALTYQNRTLVSSITSRAQRMRDIVGGASLAYILDVANRATYKARAYNAILQWDDLVADQSSDHDYVVGVGSAFFAAVLALDVIYADLTTTERTNAEAKLALYGDWLTANQTSWRENRYGALALWALFKGEGTLAQSYADDYRAEIVGDIAESGAYVPGPGYADARFGAWRFAKAHFMDVATYQGLDDWYSDPKMIGLYEWLVAGTITPLLGPVCFGDTDPTGKVEFANSKGYPAMFRTYRFSSRAAKNAAWAVTGRTPGGTLLNYVLQEEQLPTPEKPTSRIWADTNASFWEKSDASTSLMGAI